MNEALMIASDSLVIRITSEIWLVYGETPTAKLPVSHVEGIETSSIGSLISRVLLEIPGAKRSLCLSEFLAAASVASDFRVFISIHSGRRVAETRCNKVSSHSQST